MEIDNDSIIKYLSIKRLFIFFDEWLSYLLLYHLLINENYRMFGFSSLLVLLFNGYGYKCYWELEEPFSKKIKEHIENKMK
tara:strand:+ start:37 stop:279 length:243 start_codon:yes stop_codon:yes gene_type:complete